MKGEELTHSALKTLLKKEVAKMLLNFTNVSAALTSLSTQLTAIQTAITNAGTDATGIDGRPGSDRLVADAVTAAQARIAQDQTDDTTNEASMDSLTTQSTALQTQYAALHPAPRQGPQRRPGQGHNRG